MAGKHDADFRVALIGKSGTGKSSTGNTIIGSKQFKSELSFDSQTKKMSSAVGNRFGRKILVVDTPGFYDTQEEVKDKDILAEIKKSIIYLSPGPHAIILVIEIGRYGKVDRATADVFLHVFGEEMLSHFFVIFTNADKLGKNKIQDLLRSSQQKELQELVKKCNGRYLAFNNNDTDPKQVEDLVKMIEKNVSENGGGCYTNKLFKDIEREMEKVGITPNKIMRSVEKDEETSLALDILEVVMITSPIWGPLYLFAKGINKLFS